MKILNKTNLKWWGNDKSETWVYKQKDDWLMIKPKKETKFVGALPRRQKEKTTRGPNIFKTFWASSLIGAGIGFGLFSLVAVYLLIKNAL
jgi:hypothetical protein